jgi:hypothetical protein
MLDAPFINAEDGRLMHHTVTVVGIEKVEVTGGTVEAQHFTCGAMPIWTLSMT